VSSKSQRIVTECILIESLWNKRFILLKSRKRECVRKERNGRELRGKEKKKRKGGKRR
jgi:hypothetical protein